MDTDEIKPEENISGTDKTTMHNAGVDVTEEPQEFVDIDSSIPTKDDAELKKVGLTFVDQKPTINTDDLSSLAEKKMNEMKEAKENETKKEEEAKVEPKITMQKEAVKETQPVNTTDDLEREFKQTISSDSSSAIVSKKKSLNDQIVGLTTMLDKIKDKLGLKKSEVKSDLENLKKVKEDISREIENIKELEESEDKIEDQLKKVEKIQEEISSIETEVEEELKS